MITKVIFHIGAPKTATSSIQRTLFSNTKLLSDQGILYFNGWVPNNGVLMHGYFCEDSTDLLFFRQRANTQEQIHEQCAYYIDLLDKRIRSTKAHTLVLSGEAMFWFQKDSILRMKSYFEDKYGIRDFSVDLFVRNPVSYWTSDCQQIIKDETYTLEDVMKRSDFTVFRPVIERYTQVFEAYGMNVYSFESACMHPYGPVGFFLAAVGFPEDKLDQIDYKNRNSSSSAIAMDILSYIHSERPYFVNGNVSAGRSMRDQMPFYELSGSKFKLALPLQQKIYDLSRGDAKYLLDQFKIDYTVPPDLSDHTRNMYDKRFVLEIMDCYEMLTPVMKKLLYRYTVERLESGEFDTKSNQNLQILKAWIETQYPDIVAKDIEDLARTMENQRAEEMSAFEQLQRRMQTPNIQLPMCFMAQSRLMKSLGQFDNALYFAKKAREYSPQPEFQEYYQDILKLVATEEEKKRAALSRKPMTELLPVRNEVDGAELLHISDQDLNAIVDDVFQKKSEKFQGIIREYGILNAVNRIRKRKPKA